VAGILFVVGALFYFLRKGKGKGGDKSTALVPHEYRKFTLAKKIAVSPNTTLFRFALPSSAKRLGLPVGSHCLLRCEDEGKPVSRAYTPVTADDNRGHFDLIIKVYDKGKMGQYLKNLPEGEMVEVKGPQGELRYNGMGQFAIQRKNEQTNKKETQKLGVKRLGMVAGGSGITPMLQIIRDVVRNPKDQMEMSLIFANVSESDILLRDELDKLAAENKNFRVFYTLDRPEEGWKGGKGFVTPDMIAKNLFLPAPDVLLLFCGPPPMIAAQEKNAKALDFKEDQYFKY